VSASSFNGEGAQGTALQTQSCLAPSGVPNPVRDTSSTSSAVSLTWSAPQSDGGCSLIGYALYRNDPDQYDAATGTEVWVEANSANDANIRNKPDLLSATVTNFVAGSVGK
jgi:hypothetical protein